MLKKADKGTTSAMMSIENKINETLALLNEKKNYQPRAPNLWFKTEPEKLRTLSSY